MSKIIRDYDPARGQAFQGDVAIVPVPAGITISTLDEIKAVGNRLILQEGEVTGHHHKIALDPSGGRAANFARTEGAVLSADPMQPILAAHGKVRASAKVGTARMFRDASAAQSMVSIGILARADLAVGFLKVEGGPVVVTHEEHDGIRLPIGEYYVGRQIESAGAEERVVQD